MISSFIFFTNVSFLTFVESIYCSLPVFFQRPFMRTATIFRRELFLDKPRPVPPLSWSLWSSGSYEV